jgi:hypothetical protein
LADGCRCGVGREGIVPLKRSALDRTFFAIVTRGWDAEAIATYPQRLLRHNASLTPEIVSAFQLIDGKATGILTHVSLMIAGLGLIAPLVTESDVEIGIVVAEIGIYLLIAVGCLRCLSVFHRGEFADDSKSMQEIVNHELILRRELYNLCNRAAIVFTVVVFLLLPALYFWKPAAHP